LWWWHERKYRDRMLISHSYFFLFRITPSFSYYHSLWNTDSSSFFLFDITFSFSF